MGKIVDSNELLRLAREGKIKNGTKIISNDKCEFLYVFRNKTFWNDRNEEMAVSELMYHRFKILSEEDEEIDIQSIEHKELDILQEVLGKCDLWQGNEDYILKVINENNNRLANAILKVSNENKTILKAIKQLDKKIKEEE